MTTPENIAAAHRLRYDNRYEILEYETGQWALRTFGGPERLLPNLAHIEREVAEYREALEAGDYEKARQELGDIVILAFGARAHGDFERTILLSVRDKMLVNLLEREWNPPDHEGVIEHVR